METGQEIQEEDVQSEEEAAPEKQGVEQSAEQVEHVEQEREHEQKPEKTGLFSEGEPQENSGSFIHGLSVGLGIGCVAAFVIMWITVFFSPQLPPNVTYENMLAIFIYPLVYLLAVGLIALTAGVVREYYVRRSSF